MDFTQQIERAKTDIDAVYQTGYEKGKAEGGSDGYYNEFWDSYQSNGNRLSYTDGFAGMGWNNETFKPKYNINPNNCYRLFAESKISGDLVDILNNLNILFNTSQSTDMYYAFALSQFTHLGIISFESSTAINNSFRTASSLEIIDELIFKEDGSNTFNTPFMGCTALTTITKISGKIGNSIPFPQSSKLTDDTVDQIINALKDYSGTTTQPTLTVHADVYNKMVQSGKDTLVTAKNWKLAK